MLTDLCKEGNSVFAKDMGDSPVAKMMAEFESDPDHPPKSALQRGWSCKFFG